MKRVEDITVLDLMQHPVWQYNNEDEKGETVVRPIKKLPVKNLNGRLVGTQIQFANGTKAWASIENLDAGNPYLTQHFLTLTVFRDGHRFTMARYHDFDSEERGPEALAAFLGLPVDDVFPISYDVSQFCLGEVTALAGTIEKEPIERLTDSQIIALAVQ